MDILFFLKRKKHPFVQYIKNVFGFYPTNIDIYKMACVQRAATERKNLITPADNERLEYLGDAILSAIIADFLFKKYPLQTEGVLTEMRSKIVNRDRLNKLAQKIGLTSLIQIDTNTLSKSAGGNALEALIGAIYLDQGYRKTRKIIINNLILTHLNIDSIFLEEHNYKSKILSWGQKEHKKVDLIHTKIDNGAGRRLYKVELFVDDVLFGEGYGYTIKTGEQEAAEKGWEKCLELQSQ